MTRRSVVTFIGSIVLTGLFWSGPITAHEQPAAPERVPDEIAHRPTAIPDRIILTWKGDPARSQAVTWRTDTSVRRAVAEIAVASADPRFRQSAKPVPATTAPLTTNLGAAHYHSVEFAELSPDTLYAYRVGDGVNWSEWAHFRTASDRPEPFSFIYFGDAQNDLKSLWSRAIRAAYSDLPKARFIIHAGDLVNRFDNDGEWGEWFYAGGWVNTMVPSIPSPGNHEYGRQGDGPRQLTDHWRPQFTLPESGPKGLEETVYYIDYQGVRIISLNSNERQKEQAAWLETVLRDNSNRWTVLAFHHPMYSPAVKRDNPALREAWLSIFDRYRVDLVLQGHDHTYARSKNLRSGANVRNDQSGTVYVVSVSGPKMYQLDRKPWMQKAIEHTQLYQIISIQNDTLRYEARSVTGELHDAFELVKQKSGINRLVEKGPLGVAERVRVSPKAR